ncbi:MAG: GTP-binding protein [Actinomycetota bacterium]|nr:GTP-binding protein [Actinomycetota bacterium]
MLSAEQPRRPLLRLATAGSVDDGKSTLVGRLLLDTDSVLTDQFESLTRASSRLGTTELDLSLLTDGLRAEREQGITIDVAYRYFSTDRRRFVLADTPGHVQYNRNTVSGMSSAEVAIILVDVAAGLLDQTHRHLAVAALLRVPHVVVAVNKMDMVGYDAEVFTRLRERVVDHTRRLGIDEVTVIPVSALAGDNIGVRSERMPWYDGPSLLEHLEDIPPVPLSSIGAARLSIQYVLRAAHRSYAGRLSSGPLRVGDEVVVLPAGIHTRVAGIERLGETISQARPGESVEVSLVDHVDVSRGDTIAALPAPTPRDSFSAVLCGVSDKRLRPADHVLIKHGARVVRGMVVEIESGLDVGSLAYTPNVESVGGNDIAVVALRLAEPLPIEEYRTDRTTGCFLVLDADDGTTVAAGIVGVPAAAEMVNVEAMSTSGTA